MRRLTISTRRPCALLVAGVIASAITPVGAQQEVGFPDGEWRGQPLVWRGSLDQGYVFAEGRADVTFDLTVQDGKVTAGSMKLKGGGSSITEGPPPVTVNLKVVGTYDLGGTATDVTMRGEVFVKGKAETQGLTVPVEFYSGVGESSFSPSFVSCNKVTGDLSARHEENVRAQGVNASLDAAFVAIRTGGNEGEAAGVLAVAAALEQLIAALPSPPKPADLLAVAEKVDAFNAKLLGLAACETAPAGFQKGLQDILISTLFQGVLEDALKNPDGYSAQDLLALLGAGIRVGAVGLSVPGNKIIKDIAKSLHTQFEAELLGKLDQAQAAGQDETIVDILIAAQQYGMDALAAKAQGALAKVQQ